MMCCMPSGLRIRVIHHNGDMAVYVVNCFSLKMCVSCYL